MKRKLVTMDPSLSASIDFCLAALPSFFMVEVVCPGQAAIFWSGTGHASLPSHGGSAASGRGGNGGNGALLLCDGRRRPTCDGVPRLGRRRRKFARFTCALSVGFIDWFIWLYFRYFCRCWYSRSFSVFCGSSLLLRPSPWPHYSVDGFSGSIVWRSSHFQIGHSPSILHSFLPSIRVIARGIYLKSSIFRSSTVIVFCLVFLAPVVVFVGTAIFAAASLLRRQTGKS